MLSKKEDIVGLVLRIINAGIKLESLEKAEKKSLEAAGLQPGDVEHTSYNEAAKELKDLLEKFNEVYEEAKRNITSRLNESERRILDSVETSDADALEKFYKIDIFSNLAYLVDRSKQIKPLFVAQDVPLSIECKYREAILCYINGRFDACCIMCRSIMEMLLREVCKDKFKQITEFQGDSLWDLIVLCKKFKILDVQCLSLIEGIRNKGNSSIHTDTLATEEDAIGSVTDTQIALRMILNDKKYFNRNQK